MFYQQVKKNQEQNLTIGTIVIESEMETGEWTVKTEEVDVSDLELGNNSDECSSFLPDMPSTSRYKEELIKSVKTEQQHYECSVCVSDFPNKRSLRRHVTKFCFRVSTAQLKSNKKDCSTTSKTPCWTKMFECCLCKKKFDIASALKRHMQNHPEPTRHKCEICDKSFTKTSHRNRHMLSHSGQRNFACDVCNKTYTRKLNRDKHRETAHSEGSETLLNVTDKKSRNFECPVCYKAYKTNAQRNKHLVLHSDLRNFRCDICERAFVKKDHLNVHMKIHSRVESFECYVCCKTFLHCSARNRHMLIHTK